MLVSLKWNKSLLEPDFTDEFIEVLSNPRTEPKTDSDQQGDSHQNDSESDDENAHAGN